MADGVEVVDKLRIMDGELHEAQGAVAADGIDEGVYGHRSRRHQIVGTEPVIAVAGFGVDVGIGRVVDGKVECDGAVAADGVGGVLGDGERVGGGKGGTVP